jgi:sensory rhodopsin
MSESPIDLMTVVYTIGAFALLIGTVPAIQLLGGDYKNGRFGFILAIPAVAGISYVSMALGGGEVLFQGYPVPVERYADWLITTPILVGYAAYVAGMSRTWIIGAALVDALMIIFGGVAVALAPPGQWIGFAASAFCHLSLLGVLYGILPSYAQDQPSERRRLAGILQNHVGLLWIAYPFVWLFGPGVQAISATAVGIIITFMDVVAKTPYVYFVYRARDVFEKEVPAARVRANRQAQTNGHSRFGPQGQPTREAQAGQRDQPAGDQPVRGQPVGRGQPVDDQLSEDAGSSDIQRNGASRAQTASVGD